MHNKLLNRTEAAEYLGLKTPKTLLNWERSGKGPKSGRTPTGKPIYTIPALDEFVREVMGNNQEAG